jgi:hypothetical protein
MTQFADFVEPEVGDRFAPKDNIGHVIVVKPLEYKTGIVTGNSPNGTDAIGANVVDLDAPGEPAVYLDALIFGGSFVDAFKPFLGQVVVVKIEQRTSKAGRLYSAPVVAGPADIERAKALFAKGDPFAAEIQTVPAASVAQPLPPF